MQGRHPHWPAGLFPLVSLLCLAGCQRTISPDRLPNIVLIVVDTLRADRLGSYGNTNGLTPTLDRFASHAVVFRNAYSTSSWTRPSMASLLTSRYPSQHGVMAIRKPLSQDQVTFPEILDQLGYRSAAFIANFVLLAEIGFAQGFQNYYLMADHGDGRAEDIRSQSLAWLAMELERDRTTPIFLYLHFMEPHWPYKPPAALLPRFAPSTEQAAQTVNDINAMLNHAKAAKRNVGPEIWSHLTCEDLDALENLYDGEVAGLDAEIGTFFNELQRLGVLDQSMVVITADHGEELLDHGDLFHGHTLYEESIRVPLILRLPGQQQGWVVENPTSLIDVAPSLIDLLHAPVPETFNGQSFARSLTLPSWLRPLYDRIRSPPAVVAQLHQLSTGYRSIHSGAIIEGSTKLLTREDNQTETYALDADPREEREGVGISAAQRTQFVAALNRSTQSRNRHDEEITLDDGARERLQALGYLMDNQPTSGTQPTAPAQSASPSPHTSLRSSCRQSAPSAPAATEPAPEKRVGFF